MAIDPHKGMYDFYINHLTDFESQYIKQQQKEELKSVKKPPLPVIKEPVLSKEERDAIVATIKEPWVRKNSKQKPGSKLPPIDSKNNSTPPPKRHDLKMSLVSGNIEIDKTVGLFKESIETTLPEIRPTTTKSAQEPKKKPPKLFFTQKQLSPETPKPIKFFNIG